MRKALPFLALALAFAGCNFSQRAVSLRDVTKSETIVLQKMPAQGPIRGIQIAGRGSISGNAEVHLILNGAVYKREAISGSVSFKWKGDWYADEAEVRYISGTAVGGTLTLQYAFLDLQ